ncbi:MAG TPA: HupE/UreJ family protein [Bryobacteraceae bacterium]|nr:HupE/UreJ family protein [Bryobacteraceae bacterium]
MASLLLLAVAAMAHDIPAGVTAQLLFVPQGSQARLIVRVPLSSMRDIDFLAADLAPQLQLAATQWIAQPIELYEDGTRLSPRIAALKISLPSDRSFESFASALAHVMDASPAPQAPPEQLLFDVLLEYPIRSARSAFSIRPGLHHLAASTTTVLRFTMPGGETRAFQFHNDPGVVPLDPRWHQAAWRFLALGFEHILDGTDHLLFLACLVIPFRRLGELVLIVTAFTIAHSVTLIASAYGLAPGVLWFPPLVETLIAASIVFMAIENITASHSTQRRWLMAFAFGLIHGFGFSFALRESLQFAGSHLTVSLLSFNAGVEIGQLLVVALLVPATGLIFRYVIAERAGTIVASAFIAHTAWHWMTERYDTLRRFEFTWPRMDAPTLAASFRWLLILWLAGGLIYWIARRLRTRTLP